MKIAVLGAGAMGALFGGYLSRNNEVWLIDVSEPRVKLLSENGVVIREKDGETVTLHPRAVTDSAGLGPMDLVIVFVKAMFTDSALEGNKGLVGPDTYLMTLQNGGGHEEKLLRFADKNHVIIGTTQHNSSLGEDGAVHHGGSGHTTIGLLAGGSDQAAFIAEAFAACGFEASVSNAVKEKIWKKLFTNTAASSLTAVLQVHLGFILDDPAARSVMRRLAQEAVAVANADGAGQYSFDLEEEIAAIEAVLAGAPKGYTSIYADIKRGAKTEVDTISGSVVAAAKRLGIAVPCHETVVALIHALEGKAEAARTA